MQDQTEEPDFYRYTLRLPMDRAPGAKGVYCSIDPNLALGVLNRATGQSVLGTHDRLLGEPLHDLRGIQYGCPTCCRRCASLATT
jgi:CubicO group peptidase (beta-lactamase class C family)